MNGISYAVIAKTKRGKGPRTRHERRRALGLLPGGVKHYRPPTVEVELTEEQLWGSAHLEAERARRNRKKDRS